MGQTALHGNKFSGGNVGGAVSDHRSRLVNRLLVSIEEEGAIVPAAFWGHLCNCTPIGVHTRGDPGCPEGLQKSGSASASVSSSGVPSHSRSRSSRRES